MTPALAFVVYALAAARVTRLIAEDRITLAPRNAVLRRLPDESLLAYLVLCRWCAGVWVAVPAAVLAWWWPDSPWCAVPALALAISYVTGLLAGVEGD